MIAVGVASPRAQGQAITSTATALIKAVSSGAPYSHQPIRVAECQQQDHRHEDLADFIHQFLNRRLRRLSVLHQTNDPRQHGFRAECLGANQQPTFTIDRAAGDLVAGLLGHRQAFAADQRFVGMALAVDHFAVHREAFAGFDHAPDH